MKFKKFISKLQSHEYELWIMKRHFTVYDGTIKDLPVSDIYNQKIKSFLFFYNRWKEIYSYSFEMR